MVKCPNIRPAYRTLREMGFTHVRVLNIPTNMHEDWFSKGYPAEGAAGATFRAARLSERSKPSFAP